MRHNWYYDLSRDGYECQPFAKGEEPPIGSCSGCRLFIGTLDLINHFGRVPYTDAALYEALDQIAFSR